MESTQLGDQVKDVITGINGIITAKCFYLNGCIRLGIQPKVPKGDIEDPDLVWTDSRQVKLVKKDPFKLAQDLRDIDCPEGPQKKAPKF